MKKLNVVILSAGKATRLEPITKYIPKCLVNIGSKTALLQQIEFYNKHYEVETFHVIVNEEFVDMVEGYLEANNIENVSVHAEFTHNGSLNAIYRFLENVDYSVDIDTIWNWADIIPQSYFHIERNTPNVITHGSSCRFRFSNVLQAIQPSDRGDVIGIYYTPARYLYFISPDMYGKNKDFVNIFTLENLQSRKDKVVESPIEKVLDFGDMEKFQAATSNLGHERDFNEVSIFDKTVEKKAINDQGRKLQVRELDWYHNVKNANLTPNIIGTYEDTLVLEKVKGTPISSLKNGKFAAVIKALTGIKKLHLAMDPSIINSQFVLKDIEKESYDKVIQRTEPLEKLLKSLGTIRMVNDVKIRQNYSNVAKELSKKILGYYQNTPSGVYNCIHGDPNFSNMFINDENQIKFIDPRGYFGHTYIYGLANYDFAKILYGCSGYDKFNEDPMFAIKNLEDGHLEFDIEPFLPNFMNLDNVFAEDVYYWLPIIWICLAGYFKNNPLKAYCAYYYGMYLAELINKKFEDKNYHAHRILLSNEVVPCYNEPQTFSIITKCPSKWLLIDQETGERYRPNDPTTLRKMWKRQ